MNDFEICDLCCDWCDAVRGKSPKTVCDSYQDMIGKVLKHHFHMGKKAIREFVGEDLYSGACYGNWERLHETDIESGMKAEDYANVLISEVWYFSDRWSWDRLLRAQWLFQCLRKRCGREDE